MGVTNCADVRFPDLAQHRAVRTNGRLVFVRTTHPTESLHVLQRNASYSPLHGPSISGLLLLNIVAKFGEAVCSVALHSSRTFSH